MKQTRGKWRPSIGAGKIAPPTSSDRPRSWANIGRLTNASSMHVYEPLDWGKPKQSTQDKDIARSGEPFRKVGSKNA